MKTTAQIKHTPGPWRIGNAGRGIFPPPEVFKEHPKTIAECSRREDARLIAAAPELLHWLKDAVVRIHELTGYRVTGMVETIAKAEGEPYPSTSAK